ncbi:hypothetical protein D3C72_1926220 [compost metagenome]
MLQGIEFNQFIDQQRHRPTIGNDVVHAVQQHMLAGAQAQHAATQQRCREQADRRAGIVQHGLCHLSFLLGAAQGGQVKQR